MGIWLKITATNKGFLDIVTWHKLLVRKHGLHVAATAVPAASHCLRADSSCTNFPP